MIPVGLPKKSGIWGTPKITTLQNSPLQTLWRAQNRDFGPLRDPLLDPKNDHFLGHFLDPFFGRFWAVFPCFYNLFLSIGDPKKCHFWPTFWSFLNRPISKSVFGHYFGVTFVLLVTHDFLCHGHVDSSVVNDTKRHFWHFWKTQKEWNFKKWVSLPLTPKPLLFSFFRHFQPLRRSIS